MHTNCAFTSRATKAVKVAKIIHFVWTRATEVTSVKTWATRETERS